ncbi:MAG: DMT family transporter [Chloroflexota bacterium]
MNTQLNMKHLDWGLLFLLSCLWGSSFLLMKIATQDWPVFIVVLGRIGIAALLLTLHVYARGMHLPTDSSFWGEMFVLGFLRASLPLSLFVWASTQIDSNLSGILNSTTPLFTAIIAHGLTQDEKLTPQRITGVLCGMLGVIILIGADALAGLTSNVVGQLAILAATCSYGFAGVYGRRVRNLPVNLTITGMLIMATVQIVPIAFWVSPPWTLTFSLNAALSVTTLAIFNTAIAFMVWLMIIRRAGANNASQVTFIIPFIAIVLGYLVLDEQLGWNMVVGLLCVLLGLAIAQGRVSFIAIRSRLVK